MRKEKQGEDAAEEGNRGRSAPAWNRGRILILLIFTGILLLLLYLSITGSAAVYGGAEQVWFYKDSPLYHLLVFMLVTALGVMILKVRNAEGREEKSREEQEERRKRFVRLLLILSWVLRDLDHGDHVSPGVGSEAGD